MAAKKHGLGRGLDSLFSDEVIAADRTDRPEKKEVKAEGTGEVFVKTALLVPNPTQPRKTFEKEALAELTASIKEYGVVTPLIVKKNGTMYEIIAGERRWRAAQAAELKEVPVIIKDYDEKTTQEVAIIENLQREDLNSIEEAKAYEELMKKYSLSQEEVAQRVSKNRSTITNTLRLLKLDERVQEMIVAGEITGGHARALLALEDKDAQYELAGKIVSEKLSVRDAEKLVKTYGKEKKKPKKTVEDLSLFYKNYEEKMSGYLGTKVHISSKDNKKGKIEIEYYSSEDLERFMDMFRTIK